MMSIATSRGRQVVAGASVALALSACSFPVTQDEAVASDEASLKNGEVLANGAPWKGVVRVELWNPFEGRWRLCTGQVTSRNTVVTAAHCPRVAGMTSFHSTLYVRITRQTLNGIYGEWLHPEAYILADVQIAFSYTEAVAKHDVAVLKSSNPWINTVQSHAAGLMKGNPNTTLWAFGYGNWGNITNPDQFDQQGRAGQIAVTYNSTAKVYRNNASATDPQLCTGDSGGPLKSSFLSGSMTYGVASQLIQYSGACGTQGEWATTSNNWQWLSSAIGGCTDKLSYIACW